MSIDKGWVIICFKVPYPILPLDSKSSCFQLSIREYSNFLFWTLDGWSLILGLDFGLLIILGYDQTWSLRETDWSMQSMEFCCKPSTVWYWLPRGFGVNACITLKSVTLIHFSLSPRLRCYVMKKVVKAGKIVWVKMCLCSTLVLFFHTASPF